ncbi:MAG: hypothetical protein LBU73_07885 [Helicobacteraceae bacterium]|jgi:hypothetical protein|nr:hypothetical protein [Helicobacteraceae bacterium]
MTAREFLTNLAAAPLESRSALAQTILALPTLAAAEAIAPMLSDHDFGVRVAALKAIRHFKLDNYEVDILRLLLDREDAVRIAAFKSLCSFGKPRHYEIARKFYEENPSLRAIAIDSFVNFSDLYEAHAFLFSLLDSRDQKIRAAAHEWFDKALDRAIFAKWIAKIYEDSAWNLRRLFECKFAPKLKILFDSAEFGYRFKLVFLQNSGEGL